MLSNTKIAHERRGEGGRERERERRYPGIAKNKLKSWLLCLQQLHSFIPS
jgi:hypothetical protein